VAYSEPPKMLSVLTGHVLYSRMLVEELALATAEK
jgi:hypothetical protein